MAASISCASRTAVKDATLTLRPAATSILARPILVERQRHFSHRYYGRAISTTSRATPSTFLAGQRRPSGRSRWLASRGAQYGQSAAMFSSSTRRARQVDFLLADVGEGITECEIVEWYVQPGSEVEEFDMLVLLQTDKATVEVTSRYKGKVTEHCYQVGEVARVGTPLCRIEVKDANAEAEQEQETAASPTTGAEEVGEADPPQKSLAAHPAQNEPQSTVPMIERQDSTTGHTHRSLATPAVRRISRDNGVNIDDVQGTGKDGRVTKDDVQQFIARREGATAGSEISTHSHPTPASSPSTSGSITTHALSGTRKAMYKAMSATWQAPHFLYTDEIDVTRLNELRSALQAKRSARAKADEPKLTLLPFLIKAMSLVLDDHPLFRSLLDAERMELRQTDAHRFSIALASSRGLVTPALPGDVRHQSILDIARNVAHLQQRGANERGLSASDMGAAGSTITLSNIGSVGGTYTFPLLPPTGQLVIGGLGRARTLPRFDASGENIVKATILTASFAADHRVVEGVELARFVDDWKRCVEDPASWMLEMR